MKHRRRRLTRRLGHRGWLGYLWHLGRSPYFRYRNARYLHVLRVAVSKELDVPAGRLEEIQRLHRSILRGLAMLATVAAQREDSPQWGRDP